MAATQDIVALFKRVANYGGQLAAGFQKNDLTGNSIPVDETGVNIIHGTVAALSQLLLLVTDHVEQKKEVFSKGGLEFAHKLASESGKAFIDIADTAVDICLTGAERKALKKKRKEASSAGTSTTDILNAGLDEEAFLKTIEKGSQGWSSFTMKEHVSRLHQIRLHLHLLDQVVSVGMLSKDMSSGSIDIQNLVIYHKRIKRTASLVGIESPRGRHRWGHSSDSGSSTDSSSSDSSSDSDSEDSHIGSSLPRPPPPPVSNRCAPPPPPGWRGPPPPGSRPGPPPLPPASNYRPPPPPVNYPGHVRLNPGPAPSYVPPPPAPSGPPFPRPEFHCPYPGPGLGPGPGPCPGPNSSPVPLISPPAYVARASKEPSEKESVKTDEKTEIESPIKTQTHEARLFRTKSKGLGFKLKSVFRSKNSLAEEMTRTLVDTESRLVAYIIQLDDFREIPHSAFHSLEATHMKTILSQLHDSEWYKTFVRLNSDEHVHLDRILHPVTNGQIHDRELVVLKVLHEEKYAAELRLLNWIPRIQLYPNGADDRRLLAIVREKLVNEKPLMCKDALRRLPPPPPPPPMSEPAFADYSTRQALILNAEYIIRFRDHIANGPRLLIPLIERVYNERSLVRQRIAAFQRRGGDVIGVSLLLTERQREVLNFVMQEVRAAEQDCRFEWVMAELSLHNEQGEICDFYPNGGMNIAQTATTIRVVASRTLLPGINAESVRHLLRCVPPRGYTGPQKGHSSFPAPAPHPETSPIPRGPVMMQPRVPCPPTVNDFIRTGRHMRRTSSVSSIASSTITSDLSFKEQVKRARKRRSARERRAKRSKDDYYSDTSSDSDADDDSIFVNLPLKKGEDVVLKLTELWTPSTSNAGSA